MDGAVRSAERCAVVKFSKKMTPASEDDVAVEVGNGEADASAPWFSVGNVIQ